MSKTNDRFNVGDTVYLSPETTHMLNCRNPLNTKGVVVQLRGGSPDYLVVDWDNATSNNYLKRDVDLMTEDEYIDSWRQGASTIGIYLESSGESMATSSLEYTFVDEAATYEVQKALDYAQKSNVKDVGKYIWHTEDTVGIGEVDEVIPIHYSFGKDVITKLADDIYEKARMNLSTSQSWELKDIVLEVLNDQDK